VDGLRPAHRPNTAMDGGTRRTPARKATTEILSVVQNDAVWGMGGLWDLSWGWGSVGRQLLIAVRLRYVGRPAA